MKLSSDGKYKISYNCANDATTGATVAVWNAHNHTPHPSYPDTATFLAQYAAEIPALESAVPAPNWNGFRTAMLNNAGYNRISLAANLDNNGRLALRRIEIAMAIESANLEVVEVLWEQVIASLPPLSKPTATEIGQLNTIAVANYMPFSFKSDGLMQLK